MGVLWSQLNVIVANTNVQCQQLRCILLNFVFFSDSCVNQFVKLVTATPLQVLSLITGPERTALENQLAELTKEEASEQCFIETALQDLKASARVLAICFV